MSERDPLDEMDAFFAQVRSRMEAGRKTYGDRSFGLQAPVLVGELEAEALDLAGWGYVLWHRLRRLREATERAEAALACACGGPVADGQTRCYNCRIDAGEIEPFDAALFEPRTGQLR